MPISINIAPGQTHWGPGIGFFWEAQGGTPPGGPFRIEITMSTVGEVPQFVWQYVIPSTGQIRGYLNIGYDEINTPLTFQFQATPKEEEQVSINVNAFTQDEAIVDTGARTLPWAQTVGLHNELILTRSTGTVTGGFTPSDRQLLQAVYDWVHQTFPHA